MLIDSSLKNQLQVRSYDQEQVTLDLQSVVVAGAGVVGASLALSLLKKGFKVYLLDLKHPQA